MNDTRSVGALGVAARLLAAILAVLSIATPTRATEGDLQLRLEVAQRRFRVGEPVSLCVALVNPGRETVEIRPMNLVTQTMFVSIRSADGGPFEPYLLGIAKDPGSPLDLAPADMYKNAERIHFNIATGRLAFPVPGRYTIRGEYFGFPSVKPPPRADVAIEITAPNAQEQAGAAVFSRREPDAFWPACPGMPASFTSSGTWHRRLHQPSSVCIRGSIWLGAPCNRFRTSRSTTRAPSA
jgi:hypothetical protein